MLMPVAPTSSLTQSSVASTSNWFDVIVVATSMEYSVPVSASSWTQNAGSVVTLSGQALAGVAITSQSVSLSGDLVLDLSALDVYDGMTFTLFHRSSCTAACFFTFSFAFSSTKFGSSLCSLLS
jgi:hypothetical protein